MSKSNTCGACDKTCKTCTGPSKAECISCDQSNERGPTPVSGECKCTTGNFEEGNEAKCKPCSDNCGTCKDDDAWCMTCPTKDFKIPDKNGKCDCKTKFY